MKAGRKAKHVPAPCELHIYDGQVLLGKTVIANDAFIAFDANGRKLGNFADQTAAAFAIGATQGGGHG
jgi:hypothetical protein